MIEMTRTNASDFQRRVPEYLSRAARRGVVNVNTEEGEVVLLSLESYRQLEQASETLAFLRKYDRGMEEIRAGKGLVKTLAELEAMSSDGG